MDVESGPPKNEGRTIEPTERVDLLLRHLRGRAGGLTSVEATRRLARFGPNELRSRRGRSWPRELARQFYHPLALLLWAAALLSFVSHASTLAWTIVGVIVLNALVAFVQEQQAERAVEALRRYLPQRAVVIRDGLRRVIDARELVPGDLIFVEEGDRISADARLTKGSVEVDMSPLTGEAQRSYRLADAAPSRRPLLESPELIFSGTSCTAGEAEALVFATGMHTEIGRIAALSEHVPRETSPLEEQVRRVAWIIAGVSIVAGATFLPVGVFLAGLPLSNTFHFAVGLLVANVPEGLLPTITLALSVGVRVLGQRGALVKRLSAVETLGSTTVICTDKTGTLTENRMQVVEVWLDGHAMEVNRDAVSAPRSSTLQAFARVLSLCNNAELTTRPEELHGDPLEIGFLVAATRLGERTDRISRERGRRCLFHFDPTLKVMSTIDEVEGQRWIHTKGAPEAVIQRCSSIDRGERTRPIDEDDRAELERQIVAWASHGLRVLAVARRRIAGDALPERSEAEAGLTLLGLVALFDPPRREVPEAVARCRGAGIRVVMLTGDHGLTASAVALQVGIVDGPPTVVTGDEVERMTEDRLREVLRRSKDVLFSRSSPEVKLHIADALRAEGEIVAMTGDGVNDAPALRRAQIGVAMGRSGTDVAREAATLVLTDDNFATLVAAVEEGRRVYDNIRKFIIYIFAHAPPEIVPFLAFALSGGRIPLPLTVLLILAVDLGTETLPALALGREKAEPGIMLRPPRPRSEGVIRSEMLFRAWLVLGSVSAALVMAAFFFVLVFGGWHLGAEVTGITYRQATTETFLAIVACQVGTAFASRTERVSLAKIGLGSNRLLLGGIAFELLFALCLVYLPPLSRLFGTQAPRWEGLLLLLPFPFIVWGADELYRRVYGRLTAARRDYLPSRAL